MVVFLAISALLARALTLNGDEQSAITSLVQAEASGNPAAVVAAIDGCRGSAACAERANEVAAAAQASRDRVGHRLLALGRLHARSDARDGAGGLDRGRIIADVQCVLVRHSGNVLEGFQVHLLKISVKIPGGDNCPKSY